MNIKRRYGQVRIKKTYKEKDIFINGFKFAVGGFLIVYGAHLLVDSGIRIANVLRIPKQVISLTLLAIGTSIPELVTALTATIKNEPKYFFRQYFRCKYTKYFCYNGSLSFS